MQKDSKTKENIDCYLQVGKQINIMQRYKN